MQQVQEASKWDGIAFTQRAHAVPLLLVRGSNGSLDATKPGFGVTLNPKVRSTFTRPHPHVSPSFVTIEAAKNDRTPTQDEWLQRASTRIPIGTDDA